MPVRAVMAVLVLAGSTLARVCPCAHAHHPEPAAALTPQPTDGGCPCRKAAESHHDPARPQPPCHDPHCPCVTGLTIDPAVVPQAEPVPDAPSVLAELPEQVGGHTDQPRPQPDSRPPVGSLPLYLTLLTLRN